MGTKWEFMYKRPEMISELLLWPGSFPREKGMKGSMQLKDGV